MQINELGQPVGQPIPAWTSRPRPTAPALRGRYCRLERLDPHRHAEDLFTADQLDERGESWTYLPYGPFPSLADYQGWVEQVAASDDPLFYAIMNTDPADPGEEHRAVGVLSLLRIQPDVGVIEAQYLLVSHVFEDLGYRRFEWKCDALNAASRSAAERLGFTFEGTFRHAMVVKGRNRDTAWYSIIDNEWPSIRPCLSACAKCPVLGDLDQLVAGQTLNLLATLSRRRSSRSSIVPTSSGLPPSSRPEQWRTPRLANPGQ